LLRRRIRRRLLSWFDRARRDLPWRHDRDPYRIWVSEVMLQQTTVAAVIPYFQRFLLAFPTLPGLAAAAEQDVLRLWEGLGYYRRARDLHRAARQLVASHGGTIPDDPAVVGELPGMGRYTTGAVLSQAYDRRMPVLEANSLRLLCRLFGRTDDPRRGPAQHWLWQVAEELLPARGAGDFNQALMELGALVCTSAAPRCGECPLADDCVARRLGLQDAIPAKAPPPALTEVREAALVVRRRSRVLLVQRPPTASRWANMWEFPHGPLADGQTHEEAATRLAREMGLEVQMGPELLTLRHGVTRFRITMACFEAEYTAGEFSSEYFQQGLWVPPSRLAEYPVSAPQRRLAKTLITPSRQRSLF
jgi:A/G-specific adenine glycosylase